MGRDAAAPGRAIIGYALLDAGTWPRVVRFLQQNPGIVYAVAGPYLAGLSVLLFADPGSQRKWWQTLLFRVPRVIAAVLALTIGIAAIGAGAWQIVDRQGYAKVEREVREAVTRNAVIGDK